MDIVGTFNHLIPSDQLEDSLLLGQNLECEASDEFAAGHSFPEDSLKNMLSDKDPMFGSACSQFNLLENEDANFQLPDSLVSDHDMNASGFSQTSADRDETQSRFARGRRKAAGQLQRKQTASRGRGRGGRRSGPFRGSTEALTKKGRSDAMTAEEHASASSIESCRAKREALLSRRFNVNEVEPSMNPVVVLRRLTVTVGGFKIELLPGPSHASGSFGTDALQSLSFHDDSVIADSNGFDLAESQAFDMQPAPEVAQEPSVAEPEAAEIPMDFGPCVNPNDVQHTNGVTEATVDAAADQNQTEPEKLVCKSESKTDKPTAKKVLKPKQVLNPTKPKHGHVPKPGAPHRGSKPLKPYDKKVQKLQAENPQHAKAKPASVPPKQGLEPQKMQANHPVKQNPSPVLVSPAVNRKPSTESSPGAKPILNKSPHLTKKPQTQPPVMAKQSQPVKEGEADEEQQDKSKIKKSDKMLQRQRSRSSRSISIDEPELFVPDNAPVVKRGPLEGDPPPGAENEAVWDSSKQCGLCSKPHSNRFMVGCGRCDDWFHGDCVGLDLAKVQQMEKDDQEYVCLKCCADEDAKGMAENADGPDNKAAPNQKQGHEPSVTAGGIRPFRKDSGDRRASTDSSLKTGSKHEVKKAKISVPSSKKPSTGQIRRSVRDSLEEILLKRLKESDMKISKEKPAELAKATEKELFALFQGVDSKYKNKYRSLTFNLKDAKNNVLFKRVLQGEVPPRELVRMSAEELASKELAAWRQRENRHTIEMIEKEQREAERRPVTKITHKGEIEIENQEPAKAPEIMSEPAPKAAEPPEEKSPESKPESPKKSKDTTGMHKSHLFDLNCKICTGRMAPPVEEATTKVVKVATSVIRRQSTVTEGENEATPKSPPVAPSALVDDLSLRAMEEGLLNFPAYESRSESASSKEDTAAFLASLDSLWKGYVDMPAVARYHAKAYPVSGILDRLTEDLPESIQVGGRISPQTVWDYVEKIRASGTKEICVVRFIPDTEEDEISYTLLYAYFSSRRRYGVVANNLKQVKDMYLIPLGSTEKIPHQIVPFDGPGLETSRPNLLLGLVIRQRPKRDFGVLLPSDVSEAPSFMESKPQVDPVKPVVARNKEKDFVTSLGRLPKKDGANTKKPTADEPRPEAEDEENVSLRFLPGVLMQPKSDKVAPEGDEVKSVGPGQTAGTDTPTSGSATPKTPTTPRLDRFIIKKKEPKPIKVEDLATGCDAETGSLGPERESCTASPVVLSLKDKPGDVSTEAFLSSFTSSAGADPVEAEEKSDATAPSTQAGPETGPLPEASSVSASDSASDPTEASSQETVDSSQQDLKAPSTTTPEPSPEESEPPVATPREEANIAPAGPSEPSPSAAPAPAPVQPASEFKAVEDIQNITTVSFTGKHDGLKPPRPRLLSPKPFNPPSHGLPPVTFPPYQDHVYHPGPVPPYPPQSNPAPFLPLHQQAPPPFAYPPAPPPPMIFLQNDPLTQLHSLPWPQPVPPQACFPQLVPEGVPGPPSSYAAPRFPDSCLPALAKGDKGAELWDRKDHYGRHRHKSEHHERERHKGRSRSRSRSKSRSRSRSRHRHKSRHSREDRHGERRKERHHSSHHRDRDKHRRDSDHEKHRRDSRDRHS